MKLEIYAPPKGRIQKRKTNDLQIITSGLQRTAGPYRCANSGSRQIIRQAYDDSASSNALASFRSGVSKPSVNRP